MQMNPGHQIRSRRTTFKRPDTQQRDEMLVVKLSAGEKKFIREQAEENNLTMAAMTRLVWWNWEREIRQRQVPKQLKRTPSSNEGDSND